MGNQAQIKIEELKENRLFHNIEERELINLATLLEPLEMNAGQFIFREHTEGSDIFFVANGNIRVCRADKAGKEVTLALYGAGDVVGEIALLVESKRVADVVCLTHTKLWRCRKVDFHAHCAKFAGLSYALLVFMAKRIHFDSMRITDLALYDVTCRVARTLYGMSEITIRNNQEVHMIHDKPTHQTLASLVGASREAVTRALRVLEDAGHLEVDDELIWLYSMPAH